MDNLNQAVKGSVRRFYNTIKSHPKTSHNLPIVDTSEFQMNIDSNPTVKENPQFVLAEHSVMWKRRTKGLGEGKLYKNLNNDMLIQPE